MEKSVFLVLLFFILPIRMFSSGFDKKFEDKTIRIDVKIVRGDSCVLQIDSMAMWDGWYGRRVNLTHLQYPEDFTVTVRSLSGDTLFVDGKSPDVLAMDYESDAVYVTTFVPMPRMACFVDATVSERDSLGNVHYITDSRLIDKVSFDERCKCRFEPVPYKFIRKAKEGNSINFAVVAEGYRPDEMDSFLEKVAVLDSALFAQPGFKENSDHFNVVAVMLPSNESGVTVPSKEKYIDSALGAHFDSFGLERLVTLYDTRRLWDAMEGIPASQVIIIANSDKYGGSGSFNEYAIATANISSFPEILIHELGHSFGWLGDEYESGYSVEYTSDFEPYEPNITTLNDFSKKWQDLVDSGEASLIEGAGYQSKGVWRGTEHCLMRSLQDKDFCVVCARALSRTIDYLTRSGH